MIFVWYLVWQLLLHLFLRAQVLGIDVRDRVPVLEFLLGKVLNLIVKI